MEKFIAILSIVLISSILLGTKLHEEYRTSQAFNICSLVTLISGVLLLVSSISVLLP